MTTNQELAAKIVAEGLDYIDLGNNQMLMADYDGVWLTDYDMSRIEKVSDATWMATSVGAGAVARLMAAGYTVEAVAYDRVVVLDPVACYSGSRKWTEYQPVTLRSAADIARFFSQRGED